MLDADLCQQVTKNSVCIQKLSTNLQKQCKKIKQQGQTINEQSQTIEEISNRVDLLEETTYVDLAQFAQTIFTGSFTGIDVMYDTVVSDNDGLYNTTNGEITIAKSGLYQINFWHPFGITFSNPPVPYTILSTININNSIYFFDNINDFIDSGEERIEILQSILNVNLVVGDILKNTIIYIGTNTLRFPAGNLVARWQVRKIA